MNDNIYLNLDNCIDQHDKLLAHIKGGNKESLKEHLDQTKSYLSMLIEVKGLDDILHRLIEVIKIDNNKLSEKAKQFIAELFVNGIYLHDLGKMNPNFQVKKMGNEEFKEFSGESNHSRLSSILFMDVYTKKLKKIDIERHESKFLSYFIYVLSYVISRHHTNLGALTNYLSHTKEFWRIFKEDYTTLYKGSLKTSGGYKSDTALIARQRSLDEQSLSSIFVISKIFYSLLICCDYYATYDFMSGKSIKKSDMGLIGESIERILNKYHNGAIYKGIQLYKEWSLEKQGENPFKDVPINDLRSQMFLEATNNLINNIEKNIFYLEAPTGSGKTNTSINLALTLIQHDPRLNKVFYIFPFNTLVDQTHRTLIDIFNDELDATIINSVTPIKTNEKKDEDEEHVDYEKGYLNYIALHYPLVITTHVRFFSMLFGCSREECIPFAHLANSVIIIDEVQSYNIKLWKEIIHFFDMFGRFLNIKIIIMSATLPRLSNLLSSPKSEYANLIQDRKKYFNDDLFKKRVALDFTLLDEQEELNKEERTAGVLKKVQEVWESNCEAKILVEFLTTKGARKFFKHVKNHFSDKEDKIFELTAMDNKNERHRIINLMKSDEMTDCLLVATQVIEAGVDIDMDFGFKSISFLDAEEQFLGRINRSCIKVDKNCTAYFFDLDEAKHVYKGDYRLELTLKQQWVREALQSKDFTEFYKRTMEVINENKNRCNEQNFQFIEKAIESLDFKEVEDRMQLIDQPDTFDLFINTKEVINGEETTGEKIWDAYKELLKDQTMGFCKKQIALSHIKEKMNYFIYSVFVRRKKNNMRPGNSNSQIGNLYYYEDGEQFFEDGKFSKEKVYQLFGDGTYDSDIL